jgi:hypothetical protein
VVPKGNLDNHITLNYVITMFKRLLSSLAILALFSSLGFAKGKASDNLAAPTIVEISPMSVTLDAGNEAKATYGITNATKITLNGLPVTADDLRAGMLAKVTMAPDSQNLAALDARDAPRTTKKPAPVHDNVWVNLKK